MKLKNPTRTCPEPSSNAVAPVLGVIFLLLISVVMAGILAAGLFNGYASGFAGKDLLHPSLAKIEIESARGGLANNGSEKISHKNNTIVLVHESGTPLELASISIRISGYGNSYEGDVGNGGKEIIGDTIVCYKGLGSADKNKDYKKRNLVTLEDGLWSPGEKLILAGDDSTTKKFYSSVQVSVGGNTNTSDNYGFKVGTEITVAVVDTRAQTLISKKTAVIRAVKQKI